MSRQAYSKYKPSGIEWLGEVPEHWEYSTLKRVCLLAGRIGFRGYSTEDIVAENEGAITLSPTNMKDGQIDVEKCTYISWDKYYESPEIMVFANDILMVKTGSTYGKVAYVSHVDHPSTINPQIMILKKIRSVPKYLFYISVSIQFQSLLGVLNTGSTIPTMTQEAVGRLGIPLPPIIEQSQIVAFLDRETARIDAMIEKKLRQVELLQEKRSALISHAVTKGLNPNAPMKDSGIEWLGEIPEHWEVKRLKHITEGGLINGLFKKKEAFGSGVKLVNVFDVYRRDFNVNLASLERVEADESEQRKYAVCYGDIFFVRSSLKLEGVGRSVCATDVYEPTVFECHLVRARLIQKYMSPEFLINFLNSVHATNRLVSLANMVTMATIGQDEISNLEIALPPPAEQKEIVSSLNREISAIDILDKSIRESINHLGEYRTALVSAAVTGKIDVRKEVS